MKDINNYETMAKLNLSDTERKQISDNADMLINSFDALSGINTDNIEPLYTVLDVCNVMREDVCVKMISRDELLANAPMHYDGFFQVPKTIQ